MTYVEQKARARPTQMYHAQRFCGLLNKASFTGENKDEVRQICGLDTKTGQAKPAGRRQDHRKLRPSYENGASSTDGWNARAAHRRKHAYMRADQKQGRQKSQGHEEAT